MGPEVCQHTALGRRAQGAAVSKKQSKVLQSERLAPSTEILGGGGQGGGGGGRRPEPNTSLVCVPSRSTTALQPCGLHDPTEGFETRQEHKLTLNTALKIFKTPTRLWGKRNS